jgi:glycosyltransferase involved in cell wall biosynthesis
VSLFHWISGSLLGLAWFSRVVDAAFGMPKVTDITRPEFNVRPATPQGDPRVSIVVPACNEESTIERCLNQLLELDYSNYEIIAVDDRSTDRTGDLMDRVAASGAATGRLKIIHIRQLPPRWLGKTHAMWTAAKEATGDWILFTDADVFFRRDALRRAICYAEQEKADHVVLFPCLIMQGVGEHMMIAFFQSLFVFGHRPWKVADPKTKDHIGVGAFNLIRRSVYEQIGTYERLRLEVLDDMKLGKVVKSGGFRQRNVFGRDLISIRWARGAMGVVRNLTKNFFSVMAFQWPRALGAIALLGFLNLMPFLGVWLARGASRIPYLVALSSMFLIYAGMSWRSRIPPYYFFLHPISTALFAYTMLRSMSLTLWNGGVEWRGTKYPLEELRKGLV